MKTPYVLLCTTLFITTAVTIVYATEIDSFPNCDCGYYDVKTNDYWSEMWHLNFDKEQTGSSQKQLYSHKDLFFSNYQVPPKFNDSYPRIFKKENVLFNNGSIQLAVTVDPNSSNPQNRIQCSGIGTSRQDLLYGSFRSFLKTTSVPGTVAGMFLFHPLGEIDIELLSSLSPPQVYFAVHPGLLDKGRASSLTHGNLKIDFNPALDYHEYRFDWYPGSTVFYVDGIEHYRMVTNILNQPGRFMLNHWTDGNANFSQGPSKENAYLDVKNMTFFFNTSGSGNSNNPSLTSTGSIQKASKCNSLQKSCSVSSILEILKHGNSSTAIDTPTSNSNDSTTTTDSENMPSVFNGSPLDTTSSSSYFLNPMPCIIVLLTSLSVLLYTIF